MPEPVLREGNSAQTNSRIARELDRVVKKFHRRPSADDFLYLLLDGMLLTVRDGRGKVRHRVVLAAYGIRVTGRRELLADPLAREKVKRLGRPSAEFIPARFAEMPTAPGIHGRIHRLGSGGRFSLPAGPGATLPGAHATQHRRQSAEKGWLLRGPGSNQLSREEPSASRTYVLTLGGALAKASATCNGLRGMRVVRVAELFLAYREGIGRSCAPPTRSSTAYAKCVGTPGRCPASPIRPAMIE